MYEKEIFRFCLQKKKKNNQKKNFFYVFNTNIKKKLNQLPFNFVPLKYLKEQENKIGAKI